MPSRRAYARATPAGNATPREIDLDRDQDIGRNSADDRVVHS